MIVVSRSLACGWKSGPRIISPNRNTTITDTLMSAPRIVFFCAKCPAPGRIHASRTIGIQAVNGAPGSGGFVGLSAICFQFISPPLLLGLASRRLLRDDLVLDLRVGCLGNDLLVYQLILRTIRPARNDLRRIGIADSLESLQLFLRGGVNIDELSRFRSIGFFGFSLWSTFFCVWSAL